MKDVLIKATNLLSIWVSIYIVSSAVVLCYPLKHVKNNQLHLCISVKIAHIFPQDGEFGDEDGSWCKSEGELLNDEDDGDLPMTPTPLLVDVCQ